MRPDFAWSAAPRRAPPGRAFAPDSLRQNLSDLTSGRERGGSGGQASRSSGLGLRRVDGEMQILVHQPGVSMIRVIGVASITILMMSPAFAASSHRLGARPKPSAGATATSRTVRAMRCSRYEANVRCLGLPAELHYILRTATVIFVFMSPNRRVLGVRWIRRQHACAKGTDGIPGNPPRKPIGIK